MERDGRKKQDRWWFLELLFDAGELLLFIPRGVFRIIKEIF